MSRPMYETQQDRDNEIVYRSSLTMREVADVLGLSESRISQEMKRIRDLVQNTKIRGDCGSLARTLLRPIRKLLTSARNTHNTRAPFGQEGCRSTAEPAACTGDARDASFNVKHSNAPTLKGLPHSGRNSRRGNTWRGARPRRARDPPCLPAGRCAPWPLPPAWSLHAWRAAR